MLKPKRSVDIMNGYFVPMYEKHWEVKIDSNENNYGASPRVLEAIKNCDIEKVSFYPFYGELSQKIADYENCDIENVKVTNGADEALQGIIQTYLESGEALLTLDISFEMPCIYAQIQGGNVIKVPFQKKWEFPLDDFINELKKTNVKIIYIASPNNPTGSTIDACDLDEILKYAKNKVVIIDETYAQYSKSSFRNYLKNYDNIFLVHSFSKDYALAGLRLGYIISQKENIANLKKVISPFSVNAIAMKAGISALDDVCYFENIKKEILQTKSQLKEFFENLRFTVYESSANFLLIDCGKKAEYIYNKLRKENIAVKLFKKGNPLEGHIRITVPTKMGFKKIQNALKIKPFLVFDMDGVLVNAKSYRETILKTYEKYTGKTVSFEEVQKIKNLGGMNNDWDLTKFLLDREGINVKYSDIVETFQKIYWDDGKGLINIETPLFNKDILKKLAENYDLAIYTGRLKQEAMFALNKFEVADIFYPIITMDDINPGEGKPNPLGLNIVKDMTISNKYYYFGDTTDDIMCAKSAGYNAIGVLPPQDKTEALKKSMKQKGAEEVINSVNDITLLLEKINEAVF